MTVSLDVRASPLVPSPTLGTSPSVSSETVTLTWNDPTIQTIDPTLVITGYIVRRRTGSATSTTSAVTMIQMNGNDDPSSGVQTFVDENLRPQSMYTYDVATSTSDGGQSDYSLPPITVTTLDKGASHPPSNPPTVSIQSEESEHRVYGKHCS